ncbi:MAG: precorrin-6A reductase [Eubacterium sp.]|nr:precorrin-6A reductase [Eubacterium sp.]
MQEIEILLFAGTTEGRALSELLACSGIRHTLCVATEYGEMVCKQHPLVNVRRGRMNQEEMERLLLQGQFAAVVDATHPFAKEATCNIRAALQTVQQTGKDIPYLRLKREGIEAGKRQVAYFPTNEACAGALEHTQGNILLTTGSKELRSYCVKEQVRRRLYVRVLPSVESLAACIEQGICGRQLIAMQGPFTAEMNAAVIRQYGISCLVTKESGTPGGYLEKLEAAERTGTKVFVISCPEQNEGDSFLDACRRLEEISGKRLSAEAPAVAVQGKRIEITLAGIGMGSPGCMTKEVEWAVSEADYVFGAQRLLDGVCAGAEKHPFYQAQQVLPFLHHILAQKETWAVKKAVILFSGDSGFYSGCQALYKALETQVRQNRLPASLRVLPGISAVAYLAACLGESYHDAAVYSIHGKKLDHLARRIQCSPKTFLLTSGVKDINWLGRLLTDAGMTECEVITGYQLSYPKQRIERHTPSECGMLNEEGMYTCLIKNPYAAKRRLTHGIADKEFLRDRVPMTKEEVREAGICKLHLHEQAVVYDIGSGTGSVSVEIAGLSDCLQVYAIEQKPEAVALLEKNKEKFRLQNITVVSAQAPEGFLGLPMATHAFIGGSGGRLKDILEALWQVNPAMRVVIHAASMETICEITKILTEWKAQRRIKEEEVVQIQVNRAKKAKSYHLMQSENPVWICAFSFGAPL